MKNSKLLKESLEAFINESEDYPLSTFWDVLVTELQEEFGITFEKATDILNNLSDQELESYEDELEYDETALPDIVERIYRRYNNLV